jgi:beta-lactamase class A
LTRQRYNAKTMIARFALIFLVPACPALLAAEADPDLRQLEGRIRALTDPFQGKVTLYAKNIDSGAAYGVREGEKVRTASTIKVPIMVTVFQAVANGTAKWDETLPLTDADKVSGSGVLREFSSGLRLPLRDVLRMMIVVSDNTATNLILERFTADAVNAEMDRLSLPKTRALRKVRGDGNDLKAPTGYSKAGLLEENQSFGLGVTTPKEMVLLLEKIERGQVVSPAASREMIEILKRQQYKEGIGRRTGDLEVASKSGALDHLRSDVGIVYSPGGRIAIAITVDDMPRIDYSQDNVGNVLIAELTKILVARLAK